MDLAQKEAELQEVLDKIQKLQEEYEAANAKTEELRQNKKKYKETIRKASELLDGLADEKGRWIESSKIKAELY